MLNTKEFLAIDFGAASLKLAEFEVNEAGGLRLKQYGIRSYGAEGLQEATREATVLKTLQGILTEEGVKAKTVNVCAPGFHVFSKFVKLPPVDTSKVGQIIEYEAKSNVPFPLEEVVWDYQIIGSAPTGELEVLLVAIKAEIVEGLYRVTETAGLVQQLADVSPAALCNAFRYNYGDLEDCTMLLDIGAKTSNLLFFEKGKFFSRSINLGANSITQDFANESKKKFDVAEKIKIDEGFVSLGGAYEEPENQDQAAISKIARQFMTRLHIQVNQTMQFYRGQQGGSAPARLFLSGGASVMPYTAQFFAEKLNVPVEYFNPLRNVQIDPGINLEGLARVAHSLGEVVGLGLRNLAHCPVELNLMPETTLTWQRFNQKKPYLVATMASLVLVVLAMALLFGKLADVKEAELTKLHERIAPAKAKSQSFQREYQKLKKDEADLSQVTEWTGDRFYWQDVLRELRQILMRVETGMRDKMRVDTGIWIEQLIATAPVVEVAPVAPPAEGENPPPPTEPAPPPPPPERGDGTTPPEGAPAGEAPPVPLKQGVNFTVVLRAISLGAEANKETGYSVLGEIKSSPFFDAAGTHDTGSVGPEEPPGTFTFKIFVGLKHPLKLQ